jgi:Domain of Unknown Function (DUF928)
MVALGLAAGAPWARDGLAQSAGQQPRRDDSLQDRGAPRGRVGAATRGDPSAAGALKLDLVAPLLRLGLTRSEQPSLYYLLSGSVSQTLQFTISTPGQSRSLAKLQLPPTRRPSLGVVRLRDHGFRLVPKTVHVWSLALVLDPNNPSRDLVASAPIECRPADPGFERSVQETPPERRHAVLAEAGYWYDAVAFAQEHRDRDGGAALAELLNREELHVANGSPPRAGAGR